MINKIASLKKFWPKFFLVQIVFASLVFVLPLTASAQTKAQKAESLDFIPQISIPGSEFEAGQAVPIGSFDTASGELQSDLLARYILAIFNYALAVVGILAAVVLMGGGIMWLTSSGDSGKITKAKQLMGGALTGMILLACSWIILNTINPELTQLQSIDTKVVDTAKIKNLVCCHPTQGATITKYHEVKGKKIALEGKYKGTAINCIATVPQCADGEICTFYEQDNRMACAPNNVCCQCTLNVINNRCWSGVTQGDCATLCQDAKHWLAKPLEMTPIVILNRQWAAYSTETHFCNAVTGFCNYKKPE